MKKARARTTTTRGKEAVCFWGAVRKGRRRRESEWCSAVQSSPRCIGWMVGAEGLALVEVTAQGWLTRGQSEAGDGPGVPV